MSLDRRVQIEQLLGDYLSGMQTREHDEDEVAAYATAVAATEPEWWTTAYAGGPPVGPSKLIRPLYAVGNPSAKPPSPDGPDVLAVKRAVWRAGRWTGPASSFDDTFSKNFALGKGGNVIETGLAGFQRQMGFQPTGQMGDETYQGLRYARVPDTLPHAGEPLFDQTAVDLLEKAAEPPPKPSEGDVRSRIADYCRRTIAAAPSWHYRQARSMQNLGGSPDAGGYSDCSEHATCAYHHAGAPDPNHRGYDGYGYTGTLISNPTAGGKYQIGDLAIYGPSSSSTQHVCTCYAAGDASSSKWCSHGSEDAPYSVQLHYRGDLLKVVRPVLA